MDAPPPPPMARPGSDMYDAHLLLDETPQMHDWMAWAVPLGIIFGSLSVLVVIALIALVIA